MSTISIGLSMAAVSLAMLYSEVLLINWKFWTVQNLIIDGADVSSGLAIASIFLVGVSFIMVTIAAMLVVYIHPLAAGSGLPEWKGYMNGNPIHNLFGGLINWVRPVGAVLSTGAGLPVCREAPLITIGGSVGVAITKFFAEPLYRRWIRKDFERGGLEKLYLDEDGFAQIKRIGCILGSAAGLATAYNAPIGGVLYMLEEVTISAWPERLTFRAFVVTIIAVLAAMFVITSVLGDELHSLVVFDDSSSGHDLLLQWVDIPIFMVVGVVAGVVSAIFSSGLLFCWRLRHSKALLCNWRHQTRWARVMEPALYASLCSLIFILVPLFVACRPNPPEAVLHGRIFRQYTCPAGQFNPLATLFMQGAEGATKLLFARDTSPLDMLSATSITTPGLHLKDGTEFDEVSIDPAAHHLLRRLGSSAPSAADGGSGLTVERFGWEPLLLCLLAYFPLAIGTAGLSVPMGNFVPSMFIGALTGRFVRQSFDLTEFTRGWHLSHAGVYASVGAGAMLSGFTHMTLAIVVLLVEASRDVGLIMPLMIGIIVSRFVSKQLVRHPYDEQLIIDKNVPYLDVECPAELGSENLTAGSRCDCVPSEAILAAEEPWPKLQQVLDAHPDLLHFPIVDSLQTRCIGLIPRGRLMALVDLKGRRSISRSDESSDTDNDGTFGRLLQELPSEQHRTLHSQRSARRFSRTGSKALQALQEDGEDIMDEDALAEEDDELGFCGLLGDSDENSLHLLRFADPAPHSVLEDTPIARIYPLFSRAGLDAVLVLVASPGVRTGLPKDSLFETIDVMNDGVIHRDELEHAIRQGIVRTNLGLRGILERQHLFTHGRLHTD